MTDIATLPPGTPVVLPPTDGAPLGEDIRREAISLFNKGVLQAQSDKNLAYRLLGSSAEVDPTFFNAWFQIACANVDMNLLPAAVGAFRRALELDQTNVKTLVNMGWRLFHMGRLKDSRKALEKAVVMNEQEAYGWINLSMLESVEGNVKKSVSYAKKAFDLDKDPVIETGLALCMMMAGQFAEGLKHFEARFPYKLQQFLNYPWPQWHGDDLRGKILFIQAEQGLGDTLSFIRFVPAVAAVADKIIMAVQPELLRLFQIMLTPYENIEMVPLPCPFPVADFWTSTTSLPTVLGLTDEEIENAPGLPVPDIFRDASPAPWKAPGRKLHVGVAWGGAPGNDLDQWRSMKVTDWLELYRCPGLQLYSLQIGPRVDELHQAGCASLIKDLQPWIRDVTDTIGVLNNLDLVVTIESALGHVCGFLDKECWVTVAYRGGDWRIGRGRERPIWYPQTRLFRQKPTEETWRGTLDRITDALRERVNARQ